MQKISLNDFVRLSSKETNKICQVSLGDLVRLKVKNDARKEIIGIVIQLFDDKMCLIGSKRRQEWWSRYVNCEILTYNKST